MIMSRRYYNAATLIDNNLDRGRTERPALWVNGQPITFRELHRCICAAGNAMKELGVRRENRVLLILEDTLEFAAGFFGAMRIGAVPVPVNPHYRPSDYRFFIEDSGAQVVITEASCLTRLNDAFDGLSKITTLMVSGDQSLQQRPGIRTHCFEELLRLHDSDLPAVATHTDDMAFWLYSSGSTGEPKGVVHLHDNVRAICESYGRHVLRLNEDDIVFGRVLFHAYGLGNTLIFPFDAGASAVLSRGRTSAQSIVESIRRIRPTVLCLVPALYNAILSEPEPTAKDLSSLRLCISAAEPLAPEIWHKWKDRFGQTILDGIGSTEMLHIFCSNTLEVNRPGSSGKPVPGYELRIVDERGASVDPGATGELLVKGRSASPFYWRQRDKSRRTMLGEWMATGDCYRVDDDGFYWYEGRLDDMIKIGGEWVSPIEVENVLLEHPLVREVAVVGVPADGVMRIKALVVLEPGVIISPEVTSEFQNWCKSRLHRFQYPHTVDQVETLPKTASGKIQRFRLRQ
jgi:benzoate-CoA ligase family protein